MILGGMFTLNIPIRVVGCWPNISRATLSSLSLGDVPLILVPMLNSYLPEQVRILEASVKEK